MANLKANLDKVKKLMEYAQSMSDHYNSDGSKRSIQIGAEYQMKCIALIDELEKLDLSDYPLQLFKSAKAHYNYFKK